MYRARTLTFNRERRRLEERQKRLPGGQGQLRPRPPGGVRRRNQASTAGDVAGQDAGVCGDGAVPGQAVPGDGRRGMRWKSYIEGRDGDGIKRNGADGKGGGSGGG